MQSYLKNASLIQKKKLQTTYEVVGEVVSNGSYS